MGVSGFLIQKRRGTEKDQEENPAKKKKGNNPSADVSGFQQPRQRKHLQLAPAVPADSSSCSRFK